MLQVAFGGKTLIDDGSIEIVDNLTFYEPGYNVMFPLELSVPKSDSIYIIVRKRDSNGSGFDANFIPQTLTATAKDATNAETLSAVTYASTRDEWNDDPSYATPVVVEIQNQLSVAPPSTLRVRVIDVELKDTTDNSFLNFRIIVEEDPTDLHFNYIPIHRTTYSDRNTFTAAVRDIYMSLKSGSDAYLLVSPYAWLTESTKESFDFSYPQDSNYYKRENTFNSEDFTFSLNSTSHTFVGDYITITNVPGYRKVCLILIDNAIFNNIAALQRSINFTVSLVGELSGIEDTFTVNLYTQELGS
jgi:hypothetical protein